MNHVQFAANLADFHVKQARELSDAERQEAERYQNQWVPRTYPTEAGVPTQLSELSSPARGAVFGALPGMSLGGILGSGIGLLGGAGLGGILGAMSGREPGAGDISNAGLGSTMGAGIGAIGGSLLGMAGGGLLGGRYVYNQRVADNERILRDIAQQSRAVPRRDLTPEETRELSNAASNMSYSDPASFSPVAGQVASPFWRAARYAPTGLIDLMRVAIPATSYIYGSQSQNNAAAEDMMRMSDKPNPTYEDVRKSIQRALADNSKADGKSTERRSAA